MRQDVEFKTEDGLTLRGWLYLPEGAAEPVPAVVLTNGFAGVKEMGLDQYSEVFSNRGLAALAYDPRTVGASDGEPRGDVDPWKEIDDYRAAISYMRRLPAIDPERIGVWGTSYSGCHVLVVGAIDRRVKCVVAQAPAISMHENLRRWLRPDLLPGLLATLAADRERRLAGEPSGRIAIVSADPDKEPCVNPTREAYDFMTGLARECAPSWVNECTLRAVEKFAEYEPGAYLEWISPTPLLMIVAAHDTAAVTDLALRGYEKALEPKKLVLLRCGHFDVYDEQFEESSGAAADWFLEHLT